MRRCSLKVIGLFFLFMMCTMVCFAALPQLEQSQESAAVVVDGKELFSIKMRTGLLSVSDRAEIIQNRIKSVAEDFYIPVEEIRIVGEADTSKEIWGGQTILMTITMADAEVEKLSVQTLAVERRATIEAAVENYRSMRQSGQLIVQLEKAAVSTFCFFVGLILLKKAIAFLQRAFHVTRVLLYLKKIPGGRWIPVEQVEKTIDSVIFFSLWFFRFVLAYFYMSVVLSLFPWTAGYSKQLVEYLISVKEMVISVFINYLPNVWMIFLIVMFSFFLLRILRFFFTKIKEGKIKVDGFYAEWAESTYKIIRFFIIVLAIISAFPYIPGSQSLAFQGISVFLGVLFSLGSSSAVANVIAGVALIYTRSYAIGDRVKIGEHMGDVMEKSLLATRIRTIKNEDITIPNSVILNNPVINYTSSLKDSSLILYAQVTVSYEVSYQTVHELLLKSAMATLGILHEPEPFVFQKNLNDVAITYEINVYTKKPEQMVEIYSDLYKNIILTFQNAGIDLLTPQHIKVYQEKES